MKRMTGLYVYPWDIYKDLYQIYAKKGTTSCITTTSFQTSCITISSYITCVANYSTLYLNNELNKENKFGPEWKYRW